MSVLIKRRTRTASGRWEITFYVYGSTEEYTRVWGDEDEMWAACPSSLPSAAQPGPPGSGTQGVPGDAPRAGTRGVLYLSKKFIDGAKISELPKWPRSLAQPEGVLWQYGELELFPLALKLTAIELNDGYGTEVEIDLLDRAQAGRNQSLALDGEPVTLEIERAVFAKYGIPFIPTLARLDEALAMLERDPVAGGDRAARAAAWRDVAASAAHLAAVPDGELDETSQQLQQLLERFFRVTSARR